MADMTKPPEPRELLAQILFDPGMVTRFPVTKPGPEYRLMCSCGETPKIGGNLTTVVCAHRLYTSDEFRGHVWCGRCPKCGRLFYGAIKDKGVLPRRPLEIKRHKIVTRPK